MSILSALTSTAVLAAEAPSESEEESIWAYPVLPHLGELIAGTICFLVLLFLAYRYAVPRLEAMLAERRAAIQGGMEAAERAQALAPDATVVGAFHNVSAVLLWGEEEYVDEDILCVGDSDDGKQVAMGLARAVTGREGVSAGKLRLARQLEPFTAVLISINRKYKTHSGLRITGLADRD